MKRGLWIVIFLFTLHSLASEGKQELPQVQVYNASSTTDLMEELAAEYMEDHPVQILLNPASSGTLARQIEEGAPADLYLSANQRWMDYIAELNPEIQAIPFLKNKLVWISYDRSRKVDFLAPPPTIQDFLSMGDPSHVPAGKYAREALLNLGWMNALQDRILPGNNVRAAMSVVEMGEAADGIVYETDALKSEKVFIAARFPEESYSPIVYSLALLETENIQARGFFLFLCSSEAQEIIHSYGFSSP